jgi:hypothetical protein
MHLLAAFLFAEKIGKYFALTAYKIRNLLPISMTTQHKNFKTISGETQNYDFLK